MNNQQPQPLTQKSLKLIEDGLLISYQNRIYKLELPAPVAPVTVPSNPVSAGEDWAAFNELLDDLSNPWDE